MANCGGTVGIIQRSVGLRGRGLVLTVNSFIWTGLALLIWSLRIAARLLTGQKRLGLDDVFISIAMIVSLVMGIMNCCAVDHGFGRRQDTLTPYEVHWALRDFWALQILYKITLNCTKISLLLTYIRVFPQTKFRILVYCMIGFVTSYAIASVVASIMECNPVPYAWDKTIPDGSCFNVTDFWYANAAFSISTDVVIWTIALPVMYRLKMQTRAKIGLMAVCGFGLIVIVASILRFLTLGDAGKAADHTYGPLISTTWTTIEANTAIVCVCVPTLKTLVVKMFQGVFGKTETETRRSSSYGRHNYSFDPESPREHQYTELQVLSKTNRSIRIPISPTTKASIRSEGIMLGNRLSIVKEFGNGSDLRRSADRDDGLNVWTLDAGHGRTKRYGDNSKRSCTGTAKSNVKIKTLDTGQCPTNGLKNKQVITNMEISLGPEANSVETSRDKKEGVNHKSNETCADLETGRTCKAYRGSIEERIGFREMLAAANGIERNAFI